MASNSDYWTIGTGVAVRNGWTCRECRQPIYKGEAIKSRDGRKIRMMYHQECFSGDADPRTQTGASVHEGRLPESSFSDKAPVSKGRGKWSTSNYGYMPSPEATTDAIRNPDSRIASKACSRADTGQTHEDTAGDLQRMTLLASKLERIAERRQLQSIREAPPETIAGAVAPSPRSLSARTVATCSRAQMNLHQ